MLGIRFCELGRESIGCEPLPGPADGAGGQVAPGQAARAASGPLQVIRSHADADLKDVLTGAVVKPGKIADIGLKAVASFRMLGESLLVAETRCVNLTARRHVPELTDFSLKIRHNSHLPNKP